MKFIYLMIKEHAITGKKYLCMKIASSDQKAINYKGSGLHWKRHIRQHGLQYVKHVAILFKCNESETQLFRETATRISKELNVVDDPSWLNLIPETGQGGSSKGFNKTKGRITITNGTSSKRIHPSELDFYIAQGWQQGLPPTTREKLSSAGMGRTAWNKGKYKAVTKKPRIYVPVPAEAKYINRSKASKEIMSRTDVRHKLSMPRKPPVTLRHTITNETKTLSISEWARLGVNSKWAQQAGKTSKQWAAT